MRVYLGILSGALFVITATYVASNTANQVPNIVTPATAADTMEAPMKPVREIAKAELAPVRVILPSPYGQ